MKNTHAQIQIYKYKYVTMSKVLCWELNQNGRYCKNYLLKNKTKCNVHSEDDEDDIKSSNYTLNFLRLLLFITVIYTVYINVSNVDVDIDVDDVYKYMQAYFIQLYKIDKEIVLAHFGTVYYYINIYKKLLYTFLCTHMTIS